MLKAFRRRSRRAGVADAVRRDDRGLGATVHPALIGRPHLGRSGTAEPRSADSAWTWPARAFTIAASPCKSDPAIARPDAPFETRARRLSASMPNAGFVHLHVHSAYSLLEGLDEDRQARRARQGRPAAGAGADRHQQHVRRAGILRQDGGLRHPADRRLRARGRFRRPGPERAQTRMRRGPRASCCWPRASAATAT